MTVGFGHEQRRWVLSCIQGFFSGTGWLVPDKCLDVLSFADCGLCGHLTLIKLRWVLKDEWTAAESSSEHLSKGSIGPLVLNVRALQGSVVKARSARKYVVCVTVFVSRCVLKSPVRLLWALLIRLTSHSF